MSALPLTARSAAAVKARVEENQEEQSEALRRAKARLDKTGFLYISEDLLLTPETAEQLVEEGHAGARRVITQSSDDVVIISKAKEEEVFKEIPALRDLVVSAQELYWHVVEAKLECEIGSVRLQGATRR